MSLGFRPFYLGGAAFAALAVPLWLAAYQGRLAVGAGLDGLAWHGHEMLFGFAPAVIAGFLLTAVRNWTGRPTPSGWALAALVALWAAGRVLLLTGPSALAVAVDLAFLPVLAIVLAVPLWHARNRRNAFAVLVLALLGAANAGYHGAYLGWFGAGGSAVAVRVSVDVIIVLMAVVGGRVIPLFSANAIAGLRPWRPGWVEWTALGVMAPVLWLDATAPAWPHALVTALFALAAAAHLVRLLGWKPWATRHNALLFILHAAYAWIPVHFALRAWLGGGAVVMPPLAIHALVVGAMAGLMLAMMTRSALGHTGRPLEAGNWEVAMFLAIQTAALARVAGPLAWPAAYGDWVLLSGLLWSLAFALFVLRYAPILVRPRVDEPAAAAIRVSRPG